MFFPKIALARQHLENYDIHAIRQNILNDSPYMNVETVLEGVILHLDLGPHPPRGSRQNTAV